MKTEKDFATREEWKKAVIAAIKEKSGQNYLMLFGVKIPLHYVVGYKELTPQQILQEPNAEIRRVLINTIYGGLSRFIRDCGGELVEKAQDGDDTSTELWKFNDDDKTHYFLRRLDGTAHDWAKALDPYTRSKMGFNEEGRKIYVSLIPEDSKFFKNFKKTMADRNGFTYGLPPGFYNGNNRT